jgi:ABC-type lipoprotein release transport system permease subunit
MRANLASMAWRNIWRNRRRTLVTLSSIAFGVMLAVLLTGIGDASWTDVIDLAARLRGGHVTVQHPDYIVTPTQKKTVGDAGRVRALAGEMDEVTRTVPRIVGQTMLATAGKSYGAPFMAVDPALEDESTLAALEGLVEGSMFESADTGGIILGAKLAENLGVEMGKKVVYTLTDRRGEIVSGLARVSGIVRTNSEGVDSTLCLLPLERIRRVLGYGPDEVTEVAIFIDDHRRTDRVAALLDARLGGETAARPWQETQPELAAFISMKVGGTIVFEIVIAILVAAGIFNTMFMSVMERLREFGVLTAIGFGPVRLFGLVMWESVWMALTGIAAAALVSAGPYLYFHEKGIDFSAMMGQGGSDVAGVTVDPILYVSIYPQSAAWIGVAVVVATVLSGLYPAWRAGRVEPVEAIKLV